MGVVINFEGTVTNLNTVKSSTAAILDCRDSLRAVITRASSLMECPTSFPYEAEILVKELGYSIKACERFRHKCISPEVRRQLEVIKLRAWVLRHATEPMRVALLEADLQKRAIALREFGRHVGLFSREVCSLFMSREFAVAS